MLGSAFLSSSSQQQQQQQQKRRSSVSPSTSSSSVVTIQRAPSFRIQPDRQNTGNYLHNPTRSPPISPRSHARADGHHARSNSIGRIYDGIGNLNRWSQSTASSGSPEEAGHQTSHSRRRSSFAGIDHFASLGGFTATEQPQGQYGFGGAPFLSPSKVRTGDRPRATKPPSQKLMLSKALQKANTAVLLDNAQNFEGAIDAYRDACALLGQVMLKSAGEEDRQKLEAIQETYHARIDELQSLDPYFQVAEGKELPARPPSDYYDDQPSPSVASTEDDDDDDDENEYEEIMETARMMHNADDSAFSGPDPRKSMSTIRSLHPRDSLLPAFEEVEQIVSATHGGRPGERNRWSKSPLQSRVEAQALNLALPHMEENYMPRPLTPRRPYSPPRDQPPATHLHPGSISRMQAVSQHARRGSGESVSWLNTVDESGSSSPPSVRSKSSYEYLAHQTARPASSSTAADFDAALDAAVEAAYDDGYEGVTRPQDHSEDLISRTRRNVELAKERVREAEREVAIQTARNRERERFSRLGDKRDSVDLEYREDEAEEEERILDEMTRDFIMDELEFGAQSKSALPRQSDSSGFSGGTWGSSVGSFPPISAGSTSLFTVDETPTPPLLHVPPASPPPHPPPSGALPAPPAQKQLSPNPSIVLEHDGQPQRLSASRFPSQSVRDRRLSGYNTKQLTIETAGMSSAAFPSPRTIPGVHEDAPASYAFSGPKTSSAIPEEREIHKSTNLQPALAPNGMPMSRQLSAPLLGLDASLSSPEKLEVQLSLDDIAPQSDGDVQDFPRNQVDLPEKRPSYGNLKKNYSSSSLKNRSFSISSPEFSDASPITPMSTSFPSISQHRKGLAAPLPSLPTPSLASLSSYSQPWGGVYLFESDFHSADTPGSPNELAKSPPFSLEPCPTAYLLRPFWLMRCLYQTIAHPRGGYLSTKLFVPRDIWNVRNVKIKNIEEKISNCDLLTAAMLKLSKVDTADADALLDEMQALENILDQTQANLSKKLGNDVGVQGTWAFFKDAPLGSDAGAGDYLASKGSNPSGKSYLSSWRKLSRKNPSAGFAHGISTVSRDIPKDALSMDTVPTTSIPNPQFSERDVKNFQPTGPNASYMGSLARLFDAVQVLDELARQIEDPGLKHSSPTHVGLELSTRHAAEFFAFYICRFVLIDIGIMLDKFIKRGSEWALV